MTLSWYVKAPGLRATREARGLSRNAFALMVGTTREHVAAMEGGCAPVPAELRPRLMAALESGFEELFTLEARDRFGQRFPRQ